MNTDPLQQHVDSDLQERIYLNQDNNGSRMYTISSELLQKTFMWHRGKGFG